MDSKFFTNNGKKEYTITWFIENYSYCWHKNGETLISPKFKADSLEGTIWTLQLYPRGFYFERKENISFYLNRSKVDDGPEDLPLKYELSVLAADGSVLHSLKREHVFRKGCGHGASAFLELCEVLLRRKDEYLRQDTLSVRCVMWNEEGNSTKVGHCTARTRIGKEKISFLHKVENFSVLKPNEKKTLQIQSPSKTRCLIFSNVYFTDSSLFEGSVIVEIVPSDKNYIIRKQKLYLLHRSGNIEECGKIDNRFSACLDSQKLPFDLTRQTILTKKSEYLPNDELSLICYCTFSTGVEMEKIEEIKNDLSLESVKQNVSNPSSKDTYNAAEKLMATKQTCNNPSNKESCNVAERLMTEQQRSKIPPNRDDGYKGAEKLFDCPSALDDLKTVYEKQRLTDIELQTETKSFPAHKLVLCARSSVFDAMLTNDMKEKNTDCIQVNDLENDTVQQLLLFLYSDNLENLQWESAIKLYYAADKYAIAKLKALCSAFLIDNLSTSTASELLHLADTHADPDLKKFAEDFILEHEEEVFGSNEWERLIETNPQLVIKTMHLKYKRKKDVK
ncbi:Speckle-type POZ protein like [Argiope bruennichi]|uniref:Speckle-type POZ protein like n=1 Tax=Argiope bruennichi TaxID=94029 RepID=A0A8T0FER8_ARGBR|nr:Speckle-type POZ protein like [Argiope bruennichi]